MLSVLVVAAALSPAVQAFVKMDKPALAITRVRVIDGTGAPPREDQTVVISGGKIAAVGPSASTPVPQGAVVLQREGGTVLPGLVGMHDQRDLGTPYVTPWRDLGTPYVTPANDGVRYGVPRSPRSHPDLCRSLRPDTA